MVALGLALLAIGIFLIRGQTWARVAGMILAGISAILNFVWLPYSPWWALLIIGIDILVIWALANTIASLHYRERGLWRPRGRAGWEGQAEGTVGGVPSLELCAFLSLFAAWPC
jgi:hypothetical protein